MLELSRIFKAAIVTILHEVLQMEGVTDWTVSTQKAKLVEALILSATALRDKAYERQ